MAINGHLRATMEDGTVYDVQLSHGRDTVHQARARLTLGAWQLSPDHFRVFVWNSDAPTITPSNTNSVPVEPPVLFKSIDVAVPEGWAVVDAPLRSAYRIPETHPTFDAWSLIGPRTPRPRHSAVPQAGGISTAGFFLNGGHRLWWDVVAPGVDPFAPPPMDDAAARKAAAVLRLESDDWTQSPLPASLRGFVPFWGYDLGRYTLEDWVIHRFGGRKPWTGPIDFGHVQWGEGHSNHHYDMIGHAVRAALQGVPNAWGMASRMVMAHLQTGIYATDAGRYAWMHTDEKTGGKGEYPGDAREPHTSHEWDEGLIAWAFLSGDRVAVDTLDARAARIADKATNKPHEVWNGAGGARLLGWFVRNLTAFHRAGLRDMGAPCEALLKHARQTNAGQREWKNVYTSSAGFAPWMQSLTNSAILDACADDGPMAGQPDRQAMIDFVRPMVEWQCREIVRPSGVAPHWVPVEDDRDQDVFRYRTTQAAWAIPQLWHAVHTLGLADAQYALKLAAAKDAVRTSGERFDEYATGNGGGPGWLKTVSSWGVSGLSERYWA